MKLFATASLIAACLIVAEPSSASAGFIELIYTDTATGGATISADLILTTITIVGGANNGDQLITGVTGTRNGDAVTGFAAAPDDTGNAFTVGDSSVDNLIFVPPNPAFFSNTLTSGFVYSTVAGSFNPYFDPGTGNSFEYTVNSGNIPGTQITLKASVVPEPSTIVMSSLGALMMGLGFFSRRRKAIAV
jgi:hypothetical protein